jgi:uncharacterized membrane protein YraQ (UPF0718 family)
MSQKTSKRDYTPVFLAMAALILASIAWQQGGPNLAWQGFKSGVSLLAHEVPLLVAAFLTAGLIQALVKKETVSRWLGAEAGWRGLALACLGGALIPGGPYVYYPIAGALLQTGAGLGVLIAFVSAKNLWSVSRLPMEFALLGSRLTTVRFVITLIIPPLLGFLADRLFGRYIVRIREARQQ